VVIILVKDELTEIYEKLKKRDELYKKAIGNIDLIINLGGLLLVLGVFPVFPALFEKFFNIDFIISMCIFIFLGLLIIIIGHREKKRRIKPAELVITERQFLNVYKSLENLDNYLKNGDYFSKMETIKILRKIEKKLSEPDLSSHKFWEALIKDYNENISLFKINLSERLYPAINFGENEPIKLAYSMIEDFAEFLINPTYTKLNDLNANFSHLIIYVSKKEPKIPLLQKRPIIKHIIIIAFFILLSYSVFYLGPKYLHVSTNTSYTTAVMMCVGLTAGYMNFIRNRI